MFGFTKKITLIALSFLIAFSAFGCSHDSPVSEEKPTDGNSVTVTDTETVLASSGKTDYKIVLPADADETLITAADELTLFFREATGATLSAVTDRNEGYSENAKIFSLGKNAFSQAANIVPDEDLGNSGFNVVTRGNTVFMIANTSRGVVYAVYDFLHYQFGYESFTDDEFVIERNSFARLKSLQIRSIPSFDERIAPAPMMWDVNPTIMRRLRFISPNDIIMRAYPSADQFATTLQYVPIEDYYDEHPEYFSTQLKDGKPNEVNYAHPEVRKIALENMKKVIEANPNLDRIVFGQQDISNWDESDYSKADIEKYGTPSSSVVLCANYLARGIREWLNAEHPGRNVKVGIFAYNKSIDAPVVSDGNGGYKASHPDMELDENVFVILAPIQTDWRYGFDDPVNPVINSVGAESIKGWSSLGGELFIWSYSINFTHFLIPFNVYNTMQERYRYYKSYGATVLYDSGIDGLTFNGTAFYELRHYLQSKLSWDVDADMNSLTDDFMSAFYGEAGRYMRAYYDGMIALTTYDFFENGMTGHIYDNLLQTKFWPKGTLDEWVSLFDKSYEAIEPLKETDSLRYDLLKNRLDKEKISVLFLLIECHPSYFTARELLDMKLEVQRIATKNNILLNAEFANANNRGATMLELYRHWGIV